jgi:hypothetical protein
LYGESDITGREHAGRRGRHSLVDHNPTVLDREAGLLGQFGPRLDPRRGEDEVGLEVTVLGAHDAAVVNTGDLDIAVQPDVRVGQPTGDPLGRGPAEPAGLRQFLHRRHRHVEPAGGERGGGLTADEPGSDDHRGARLARCATKDPGVLQEAQPQYVRVIAAWDGQCGGLVARSQHAAVKAQLAVRSGGERHDVRSSSTTDSASHSSIRFSRKKSSDSIGKALSSDSPRRKSLDSGGR